jgi:hypothetical protein
VFSSVAALGFLDSREKALLVWVVALTLLAVIKVDGFIGSVMAVLRSLTHPKLVLLYGSTALYCATLVFLANAVGVWHTTGVKATVYWFFGTGVILAGNAVGISPDEPIDLRKLLRGALRFTLLVEFLVNLYVLPFAAELFLVPLIATLVMQIAAQYEWPIDPRVPQFVDHLLKAIGLGLIAYVVVTAATDLSRFLARENVEDLVIAPMLTLALVPFLWLTAWYSRREQVNLRKRWHTVADPSA